MSVAQRKARMRRNNESNRREELLRVSAKLFREKGFDGTSIRDISNAAGMHSGSPFYHFKTKQDILVAVMEQGLAEGLRKTEEVMALTLLARAEAGAAHPRAARHHSGGRQRFHPGAALRLALAQPREPPPHRRGSRTATTRCGSK